MRIGYARVSSPQQSLERQIIALEAEGVDRIYREKASGKSLTGRPQLQKAIDALGQGDVLVIAEWDRATRSMNDGLALIAEIGRRKAMVKVLDRAYLDLTQPMYQGILALLSGLADDERKRIHRRAAEGRQIARSNGIHMGRPPKLTPHQQKAALERLAEGHTTAAIARDMNVHRSTISRLQKKS